MSHCDQETLNVGQTEFTVGDVVYVGPGTQRIGKIEFIGETQFASGVWIGVNLFSPCGKNDGCVDGVTYFTCSPLHGIFSKRGNVRLAPNPLLEESCSKVGSTIPDKVPDNQSKQNSVLDVDSVCSSKVSLVNSPACASGRNTLQIGDHVQVSGGRIGILRYLGPTEFAVGEWAGVELDSPIGKNDGSVSGVRYFTCKPNHGLFAAANKVVPAGSKDEFRTSGFDASKNSQTRRSQESLLSYSSNLSSVSRSYRLNQVNNGLQSRNGVAGNRRPISSMNTPNRRESTSNLQTLQRLVKEKEAHIEKLLQEREMERSDLAKVTLEREMAQAETLNQQAVIQQLNQQLENMEAVLQHLRDEHEQTTIKLHEERKNLEDLQFRIEEENIDKSTTESQNADDESKIFELEEALMSARETNERMELELNKLRVELNDLLQKQTNVSNQSDENKSQIQGKPSLQFTGLVSETSITPTENEGESFQNECEWLRNLLAERQAEAEIMLKHQAETIESLTVEFNGQVEKLNCQLQNSSNEIQAFKNENNLLKQQNNELVLSLKSQIDQLNKQLTEQEKIANEKLSMFENRIKELNNVLSAVESFHSVQIEEVNNLQLINKINNDDVDTVTNQETIQLLLEKLKVQEELFNEQKDQLLNTQLQTIALNQDKENSNNKLNEVENYLNKLKIELNESRIKQEELLTELNSAHLKRDQLVEDISKVLGDLSLTGNAENLSTILCNRINDLKEQISGQEKVRQDLEKYCQTLESERNDLESELTRVNVTLKNSSEIQMDNSTLKEELDNARQKMFSLEKSASNAFSQLEIKSNELQTIQSQLDKVLNEQMELEKVHNHTITALESDKQVLLERIKEAENRLLEHQPNSSTELTNQCGQSDINRLIEEKASTESQVNFLNSIIVDLHAKNAELESRVRAMLVGTDEQLDLLSNKHIKSRNPPPTRLWCDNCLVFDSHDTKDCSQTNGNNHPHQHYTTNGMIKNSIIHDEIPRKSSLKNFHKISKQNSSVTTINRLYCDNCGIFDDHITENCTDTQTF
ncbi:CAP-GLY domain-containing linker protein 1, variant 2 [Schistosoma haematobium]|uniref:CAP-GLY domain-containing linker protein 1, variant 2 n=1 Tax=Schistosoma haematobium TaxID=6185 RepID=A0A922LG29_SCHHA|nr:CAP-GLY domain-containing linker protein 1, variant 2 [Schistosoma haematobium]KAH9583021.1 CAP-GLY domain-containing linker protein 1, variant 2 [Schistosoma haematobium]